MKITLNVDGVRFDFYFIGFVVMKLRLSLKNRAVL